MAIFSSICLPAWRSHMPKTKRRGKRSARVKRSARLLYVEPLEERVMMHGDEFVKWTFGDTTTNRYVLAAAGVSNIGQVGGDQPTLRLELGSRYSVTIADPYNHPLQIIAKGATAADDVVLLSQHSSNPVARLDTTPLLENNPEVDFRDDLATHPAIFGDRYKTISFTLTQKLADAMVDPSKGLVAGYRCGNQFHRDFQRGDFTLFTGAPADPSGGDDLGHTLAAPHVVSFGTLISASEAGAIPNEGAMDVFQFVAPTTGALTAALPPVAGSALDGVLFAFDRSGHPLTMNAALPGADAKMHFNVIGGQTYFVQASGFRATTGAYHLYLLLNPLQSPFAEARAVALDDAGAGSATGDIARPGDVGTFFFEAPITGKMSITQKAASGSSLDSLLSVSKESNSGPVLLATDEGRGGGKDSQVQVNVVAGQIYLVQATGRQYFQVVGDTKSTDVSLSTGAYSLDFATDDFSNTFPGAFGVTLDSLGSGSQEGNIERAGNQDKFRFVAPVTALLTIQLTPVSGGNLKSSLEVFDNARAPMASDHDPGRGFSQVQISVTAGQTYFVEAAGAGASTGRYKLVFAVPDANGTLAQAAAVPLDATGFATVTGTIGVPRATDFFRFVAPVSGSMVVTQRTTGGTLLDSILSAFDAGATLLDRTGDENRSMSSQLQLKVAAGQTYYVQVAGLANTTGTFDLVFAVEHVPDTFISAPVIPLDPNTGSGRQTGNIGVPGAVDLYQFRPVFTGSLFLALNSPLPNNSLPENIFDGQLTVFNQEQTLIASDDDSGGGYSSLLKVPVTAGQTYFVQASGFAKSTGTYELVIGNDFGTTFATASPIALGPAESGRQSGRIPQAGQVDVFKFQAAVSGPLAIVATAAFGSGLKTSLTLFYDAQPPLRKPDSDSDFANKGFSRLLVNATAGQYYYVQVGGAGATAGQFNLDFGIPDFPATCFWRVVSKRVSGVQVVKLDFGIPDFSGTYKDTALVDLSSGSAGVTGAIEVPFSSDFFRFTAPFSGTIGISENTVSGSRLSTSLGVFDTNGAPLASDSDTKDTGFSRVQVPVIAGQTYIVQAAGTGTSTGQFGLDFRGFQATPDNLLTQDLKSGVTKEGMVNALVDKSGITVSPGTITYNGDPGASGSFSGGQNIVGFDRGALLTTGLAKNVTGPHYTDNISGTDNGKPGDPQLDLLVGGNTQDAAVLAFDFTSTVNVVQLQFVFASTEYSQFVRSVFDDVFGCFINGVDYARIPQTGAAPGAGDIVSINTVTKETNSSFFRDNSQGPDGLKLNTTMNGLTTILTLRAPVKVGEVNHISFAIADRGDPLYDSAVFLQEGSFRTDTETVPQSEGKAQLDNLAQKAAKIQAQGAGLTQEQASLSIHKAVVNGVINSSGLLGDFLVVSVDPVDFTLTNENGLQVAYRHGQDVVNPIGNAFFKSTTDGVNQLLIIPNALAGQYHVELVGVGSGTFRFGASFVTDIGQVTSSLLQGEGNTVAVLDFRNPDGRIEQTTLAAANPVSDVGKAPGATTLTAGLLASVVGPLLGLVSGGTVVSAGDGGLDATSASGSLPAGNTAAASTSSNVTSVTQAPGISLNFGSLLDVLDPLFREASRGADDVGHGAQLLTGNFLVTLATATRALGSALEPFGFGWEEWRLPGLQNLIHDIAGSVLQAGMSAAQDIGRHFRPLRRGKPSPPLRPVSGGSNGPTSVPLTEVDGPVGLSDNPLGVFRPMAKVDELPLMSEEPPGQFLLEISREDHGWADLLMAAFFASGVCHARWAEDRRAAGQGAKAKADEG